MASPTDQPSDTETADTPPDRGYEVETSDSPETDAPKDDDGKPGEPKAKADDPAGKDPKDDPDSDPGKDKDKRPRDKRGSRGAQHRIKQLTRKLADAERKNQSSETELQEMRDRLSALEGKGTGDPKPKFDDFDSPEEYAEEFSKWKAGQAKPTDKPKGKPDPTDTPAPNPDRDDFIAQGTEQLGDEFLEALEVPNLAISQGTAEFMFDSEYGSAIFVHLANNPDEALRIHNSTPTRQAKLLDALETKAEAGELDVDGLEIDSKDDDPDDDANAKNAITSKAPKPPSDDKDDDGVSVTRSDDALPMDDWMSKRRGKEAQRRKHGFG